MGEQFLPSFSHADLQMLTSVASNTNLQHEIRKHLFNYKCLKTKFPHTTRLTLVLNSDKILNKKETKNTKKKIKYGIHKTDETIKK